MKGFTGDKYWEHKNPAYRESCFRKHCNELVILKGKYDFFIKETSK